MKHLILYVAILALASCTPVAKADTIDTLGKNYACTVSDVDSFCSLKNGKLVCTIELLDFSCTED